MNNSYKSAILICKEVIIMITAIANRIADFICSNSDLADDERDLYVYGYEIAISSIITFSLLIITGLLFSRLIEAIVFFAVFYLLRRRTGGYHADTYLKCNLIFELNVLSVLLICCLDIPIIARIAVNLAIFILCLIITAIKAPISNPNKPISEDMKSNHKKWALALIITFELISVFSFNWPSISICISLAMASTAIAMIIIIERREN